MHVCGVNQSRISLTAQLTCLAALLLCGRRVVWFSDADAAKGYSIHFRSMSMHALSRDTEAFPHPCIYAQVEVPRDPDAEENDEDENGDDEGFEGDEQTIELRFVPDDASTGEPHTPAAAQSPHNSRSEADVSTGHLLGGRRALTTAVCPALP